MNSRIAQFFFVSIFSSIFLLPSQLRSHEEQVSSLQVVDQLVVTYRDENGKFVPESDFNKIAELMQVSPENESQIKSFNRIIRNGLNTDEKADAKSWAEQKLAAGYSDKEVYELLLQLEFSIEKLLSLFVAEKGLDSLEFNLGLKQKGDEPFGFFWWNFRDKNSELVYLGKYDDFSLRDRNIDPSKKTRHRDIAFGIAFSIVKAQKKEAVSNSKNQKFIEENSAFFQSIGLAN